jgi:hypothetical protein
MADGPNNNGFNLWSTGGKVYAGFLAGGDGNNTGGNVLYTEFDSGSLTIQAAVPLPAAAWLLFPESAPWARRRAAASSHFRRILRFFRQTARVLPARAVAALRDGEREPSRRDNALARHRF